MNGYFVRRGVFLLLAAALLGLIGGPSRASAETLTLTLDKAISLGAENSPDLKAARLAVQSSLKDVKAAKAARYPGLLDRSCECPRGSKPPREGRSRHPV